MTSPSLQRTVRHAEASSGRAAGSIAPRAATASRSAELRLRCRIACDRRPDEPLHRDARRDSRLLPAAHGVAALQEPALRRAHRACPRCPRWSRTCAAAGGARRASTSSTWTWAARAGTRRSWAGRPTTRRVREFAARCWRSLRESGELGRQRHRLPAHGALRPLPRLPGRRRQRRAGAARPPAASACVSALRARIEPRPAGSAAARAAPRRRPRAHPPRPDRCAASAPIQQAVADAMLDEPGRARGHRGGAPRRAVAADLRGRRAHGLPSDRAPGRRRGDRPRGPDAAAAAGVSFDSVEELFAFAESTDLLHGVRAALPRARPSARPPACPAWACCS